METYWSIKILTVFLGVSEMKSQSSHGLLRFVGFLSKLSKSLSHWVVFLPFSVWVFFLVHWGMVNWLSHVIVGVHRLVLVPGHCASDWPVLVPGHCASDWPVLVPGYCASSWRLHVWMLVSPRSSPPHRLWFDHSTQYYWCSPNHRCHIQFPPSKCTVHELVANQSVHYSCSTAPSASAQRGRRLQRTQGYLGYLIATQIPRIQSSISWDTRLPNQGSLLPRPSSFRRWIRGWTIGSRPHPAAGKIDLHLDSELLHPTICRNSTFESHLLLSIPRDIHLLAVPQTMEQQRYFHWALRRPKTQMWKDSFLWKDVKRSKWWT